MTTAEIPVPGPNAEGVRWDLSPLVASADDARALLESGISRARAFETRYRGVLETMTPDALAAALGELAEIGNILSRAVSYAHLREATDVADPDNIQWRQGLALEVDDIQPQHACNFIGRIRRDQMPDPCGTERVPRVRLIRRQTDVGAQSKCALQERRISESSTDCAFGLRSNQRPLQPAIQAFQKPLHEFLP